MQAYVILFLTLLALWAAKLYVGWRAAVRSLRNFPGLRYAVGPDTLLMMWRIPYVSAGAISIWQRKHQDFAQFGSDIISSVRVLPTSGCALLLADAAAIKEVTSQRTQFVKPLDIYKILTFYGSNVVVTEGDEWKRHRKISAPSFSERNNRLVWDETILIVQELCQSVWAGKNEFSTSHIVDLTVPIALFVIGVAGFGKRMSWVDDLNVPPGYRLPFKDALHIVSTDLRLKLFLPDWVFKLGPTKRVRDFWVAYHDLQKYMTEMIEQRRVSGKREERYDLFSCLLDANDEESDRAHKIWCKLSWLMQMVWQTTAHTLAYTFIMLALYPDEQEILHQHIMSVVPDDRLPSYEEMGKLAYVMAVFQETLRMFPPVINIPKQAEEDAVLVTQSTGGEKRVVPCPKGTGIIIHTPGLHYNPRYWEDPYAFKPSRFLGDWPRDAFLPFSGGSRSCLGRRFSETEGVATLTYMIKHFKVEVAEEQQYAGENFERRKERLLKSWSTLTLYPLKAPLVFKRRL